MPRLLASAVVCVLMSVGCKGPPEAPRELEDLTAYLFDKTRDGSDEELAAGLENLHQWLQGGYEEAQEGYRISVLKQSSVDALDHRSLSTDGLDGAAVATRIGHKIKPVVEVIARGDNTRIYGNLYESYQRDWETDGQCHTERECLWGAADIEAVADYGLATVASRYRSEYRWVRTTEGWAHLQRTWLLEPVEVLGVRTHSSFYLGVSIADGGQTQRLQASWAAIETDLPISEDAALNQTIKSLIDTEEDIDAWLD